MADRKPLVESWRWTASAAERMGEEVKRHREEMLILVVTLAFAAVVAIMAALALAAS